MFCSQVHKLQGKGWHAVLLCYRKSSVKTTLKQTTFGDPELNENFVQLDGKSKLHALARIFYRSERLQIYALHYLCLLEMQ